MLRKHFICQQIGQQIDTFFQHGLVFPRINYETSSS